MKWAQDNGYPVYCLKLTILGFRGWPDRMVLWPRKGVLFIEFKRPGFAPRKLQEYVHGVIEMMGFPIEVYDDDNIALAAVQARIRAALSTDSWHEDDSVWKRHPSVSKTWNGQDCYSPESVRHTEEERLR